MAKKLIFISLSLPVLFLFSSVSVSAETSGGGGGGGGASLPVKTLDLPSDPNLAIMIDNQKDARPLSGVNEADAVYEFPVEGGITRLMAIYRWDSPAMSTAPIGPVRSARPWFARSAGGHQAVFAHAGGSAITLSRLNQDVYSVADLDALKISGADYFWRDNERSAPHNLFTSLDRIKNFYSTLSASSSIASSWPWTMSGAPLSDAWFSQNEILVYNDGGKYNVKWTYSPADLAYQRFSSDNGAAFAAETDSRGRKILAENIAVMYAKTNSLQEVLENTGRALVCRQGKCQNAAWEKTDMNAPTEFFDFSGQKIEFLPGKIWINVTQNTFFHDLELAPGWNIVSTPRLLANHQFSAPETLQNFSVYALDPESASGWSTLAELKQTEFTPLYGYFINNKTGQKQILTLNYKQNLSPSEQLFTRELKTGWNTIGIANPDLDAEQNAINNFDADNVQDILASLDGKISTVLDFTNNPFKRSNALSDTWQSKPLSQANSLDDFRTTKAYGVYSSTAAVYHGYQNLNPIHHHKQLVTNLVGEKNQTVNAGALNVNFGDIYVSTRDNDIYVYNLPLAYEMNNANANDNLQNIYLLDVDRGYSYYVYNNGTNDAATIHNINLRYIYLNNNQEYHFRLVGDIPNQTSNGQSYRFRLSTSERPEVMFGSYHSYSAWQPLEAADFSYNTTQSEIIRVKGTPLSSSTLEIHHVSTNNNTVVSEAKGVLLYKGKASANDSVDLYLQNMIFEGQIGSNGNIFGDDWEKIYLYQVNGDGTETLLDETNDLTGTTLNFSNFEFRIPKGIANGQYFTVRGDVKSSPLGTTTEIRVSDQDWTVFSYQNPPSISISKDLAFSHATKVQTQGSFILKFDNNEVGFHANQNILAGGLRLVGRIKASASGENAIIDDLAIANLGTADNKSLGRLYLFDNKELSGSPLAYADLNDNKISYFENINLSVPTTGARYFYVGAYIKAIDYSSSPSADATAEAEKTVELALLDSAGYDTKVIGQMTGLTMADSQLDTEQHSAISTVLGTIISAVSTSFMDATLSNGISKTIFSFKVTAPASANIDFNGDPLAVRLAEVKFTVSKSANVNLSSFQISRTSGSDGNKTAAIISNDGAFLVLDFADTFGSGNDLKINPGETAEYRLLATIAGATSNDYLQIIIADANQDLSFTHNTGAYGADGPDTSKLSPRLFGDTMIDGGSLSN